MTALPSISAVSTGIGPVTSGISVSNLLIFTGKAVAGGTVAVMNGTAVIGTATADASGAWTLTVSDLPDGTYDFTAAAAGEPANPETPSSWTINIVPNITEFSGSNNATIKIGNNTYVAQNASKPWSLANPDTHTLRYEMRGGDIWPDGGSARSEVASYKKMIPAGAVIDISYQFQVEPGPSPPTTSQFVIIGQLHGDDNAWQPSPAWPEFSFQLIGPTGITGGDHLAVQAAYAVQGRDTAPHALGPNGYLYIDQHSIERGRPYRVLVRMKVDNTSNGFLEVWLDGTQIVNYHGPLGYGHGTYWKEGIYRDVNDAYTMAVNYKNLELTYASSS